MKQDQSLQFSIRKLQRYRGGQAVVEYILLCIVLVGMLLAAKQLFSSFNKTIDSYIGDYMTCLMEYGELPSLGVARSELRKHETQGKTCEAKFEPFSIAQGRPPTGGGGGSSGSGSGSGSGGSNSSSNSNNNNNSNSASNNNNSSGSSVDGDDSGSGSSRNGRNGRGGGSARRGIGRSELAGAGNSNGSVDGDSEGDSKTKIINEDGETEERSSRRGRRRFYSRTDIIEYKAVTGGLAKQIQKQEEKRKMSRRPTTVTKVLSTDEGSLNFRTNRRVFTPPEKEKPIQETRDSGKFTFGWFIRALMIAAMILAIVVFFGGQVLNYTKSKD